MPEIKMLRASTELYRAVIVLAKYALFILEEDVFVDCNPEILELFGGAWEDLIGTTPYHHSPDRLPDCLGPGNSVPHRTVLVPDQTCPADRHGPQPA